MFSIQPKIRARKGLPNGGLLPMLRRPPAKLGLAIKTKCETLRNHLVAYKRKTKTKQKKSNKETKHVA